MSWQGAFEDERGFTLIEVIVTIILMGILFAIASSMWFGAIESRRVDDGTNRLAADLRHAHSRAINRLEPQTVTLTAGSSKYTMTGVTGPGLDLDDFTDAGAANDVVVVNTSAAITFNSDGSATLPGGAATLTRTIRSADGAPAHNITINAATSRVQVVP